MNKFIEYRREFHKYAENSWHEIRTSARVAEILEEMGYSCLMGLDAVDYDTIGFELVDEEGRKADMERAVEQGANPEYVERTGGFPGVVAIFDTGKEGPVTGFRFDIDALPYEEPKKPGFRPFDEGYISVNDGSVHACGHDGHTAIGLGIAEALLTKKDEFKGKIVLAFQPAEESYHGAQSIVNRGHFDEVTNFISLHLALSGDNVPLPSNTVACGCKDFLSCRQLTVHFHGRSAHPCGAAQEGKNALLAACTATLNLHAIPKHESGLTTVNVGQLSGGVAANTIAPNAELMVEFRGENRDITDYLEKRVFAILDGAAAMHDVTYTFEDYNYAPATKSDDTMMEVIQRAAKKVPWFQKIYFEGNVGGSDDATAMLIKAQDNGGIGTYIGIGTDTTQPLHNEEFDFDEDCIPASIDLCMYALEELHA